MSIFSELAFYLPNIIASPEKMITSILKGDANRENTQKRKTFY